MFKQIEKAGQDILTTANDTGQEIGRMQKMANKISHVLIAFFILNAVAAISFSLIEGKDLTNGFWWATVTATTVGYGDLYPTQLSSKLIGGAFMYICVFIVVPIITAKMSAQLIVDSNAFTHQEQEELKAQSEEQVALLRELLARMEALEANQNKSL